MDENTSREIAQLRADLKLSDSAFAKTYDRNGKLHAQVLRLTAERDAALAIIAVYEANVS